MSTRHARLVLAAIMPLVFWSGCADDVSSSGTGADCNVSIGIGEAVYVYDTAVDQEAERGEKWTGGQVLDCDETPLQEVAVYVLTGIDSHVAVAVVDADNRRYDGVYVNRDVPRAAWPSQLTDASAATQGASASP